MSIILRKYILLFCVLFISYFKLPIYADVVTISSEPVIIVEETTVADEQNLDISDEEIIRSSNIYAGIPLTADEVQLMARMACGEARIDDGSCPPEAVIACYEVVFNRYLHDLTTGSDEFHKGTLTISRIVTRGQFEGLWYNSTYNKLPATTRQMYENLVWQVHNQGPAILTTDYLYWQSRGGTRCKNDRIWIGYIINEAGEKIAGSTTQYSQTVKYGGNWFRKKYK